MRHNRSNGNRSGFTLIELALVLGVVAVLAASLWRLISNSNQTTKDQNTAQQHQQLISAVKGFLASPSGQNWMATIPPYTSVNLQLPSSNTSITNCQNNIPVAMSGFCTFLPSGFTSGTLNPYGQSYYISVLKDGQPNAPATAPVTYSFMILAYGTVIPDTDGGRISSMIGGDGGFIFTANVCGTGTPPVPMPACGALGAWSVIDVTLNGQSANNAGYGIPVADALSGSIASRTFVSPTADNSGLWLARDFLSQGPGLNTMDTNIYMGGNGTFNNLIALNPTMGISSTTPPAGSGIYLGASTLVSAPTSGSTNIYMGDGTAIMGVGTAGLGLVGTGIGLPDNPENPTITITGDMTMVDTPPPASSVSATGGVIGINPLLVINGTAGYTDGVGYDCALSVPSNVPPIVPTCQYAMEVNGDVSIAGLLTAERLFAENIQYKTSDIRLKKNIKTLSNPLADIMRINPVSFTFKKSGEESMGVIAQELEKIYPQLVANAPDGYKAVAYDSLIAPLIGAVQELKKQNDELRKQNSDLQAELLEFSEHQKKIDQELESLSQK